MNIKGTTSLILTVEHASKSRIDPSNTVQQCCFSLVFGLVVQFQFNQANCNCCLAEPPNWLGCSGSAQSRSQNQACGFIKRSTCPPLPQHGCMSNWFCPSVCLYFDQNASFKEVEFLLFTYVYVNRKVLCPQKLCLHCLLDLNSCLLKSIVHC